MTFGADDLVEENVGDALYELTRAQETDLPVSAKVSYISSLDDYPQAVAEARRLTGASNRVAEADLPIVLDDGLAGSIVESWLYETWATRESATFGFTLDDVAPGPEGRLDRRASFRVRLTNGALASVDLVSMLAGVNLAALRNSSGDWEIIQFQNAELVDTQTYRLSGLLRGQFGTETTEWVGRSACCSRQPASPPMARSARRRSPRSARATSSTSLTPTPKSAAPGIARSPISGASAEAG